MRVLIVVPYIKYIGEYHLPMGLAYISAALRQAGYEVVSVNLNEEQRENYRDRITEAITRNSVSYVLTGGLTRAYHEIKGISEIVHSIDHPSRFIVGGGIVTSEPELMCRALGADYVVLNEGEVTIVELLAALNGGERYPSVPGVGYVRDGEWVRTVPRTENTDIDALPIPDYDIVDMERYFSNMHQSSKNLMMYVEERPRAIPVITSRSCPMKCTFCFQTNGPTYRYRDLDRVIEEVEFYIEKYGVNILLFSDQVLAVNKVRIQELSRRLEPYGLHWACSMIVGVADEETLEMMKRAGCHSISYGIESASNVVLKSMGKRQHTIEQAERSVRITREAGIGCGSGLIFGDPVETMETARETLNWYGRQSSGAIFWPSMIVPFPGTKDYEYAVSRGVIKDRLEYIEQGCPPVNFSRMSDEEYAEVYASCFRRNKVYAEVERVDYVGLSDDGSSQIFRMTLVCPHCGEAHTYGRIHEPRPEDSVFWLGCLGCNGVFDVHIGVLPYIRDHFDQVRRELQSIAPDRTVVVTPCIPENDYSVLVGEYGVGIEEVAASYYLDADIEKAKRRKFHYVGECEILLRDRSTLERWSDAHVVILPSVFSNDIYRELVDTMGISADDITVIHSPASLSGAA